LNVNACSPIIRVGFLMRFYKNQVTTISLHHCPWFYAASVNPLGSELD
jgi:hypothetical protein